MPSVTSPKRSLTETSPNSLTPEEEMKVRSAIALLALKLETTPITEHLPLCKRIRWRNWYDFDLQKIETKVRSHSLIFKWECSYFMDCLIRYLEPQNRFWGQKKNERLETLAILMGLQHKKYFYSDPSRRASGFCTHGAFLNFVGIIVLHMIQCSTTRENTSLALLNEVGRRSFELVMLELKK